jgi:hypothetical protein
LSASFPKESWQENKIVRFMKAINTSFVTETFLMCVCGAPPTSIGKFGSDTDNWVWPYRDFHYSEFADKKTTVQQNIQKTMCLILQNTSYLFRLTVLPKMISRLFWLSRKNQRILPSVAIEQIVNELNPAKIEIRDKALKVADGFMRKDNAIKIQYASKYASIVFIGKNGLRNQGLQNRMP